MQERKTAKANAASGVPATPNCAQATQFSPAAPPRHVEDVDIMVEESPGQDGPDTIIEKVNNFWNR